MRDELRIEFVMMLVLSIYSGVNRGDVVLVVGAIVTVAPGD